MTDTSEMAAQHEKAQLRMRLETAGIDLSKWGKGEAKTLDHLLGEVHDGEMELIEEGGELLRKVTAATADIFYTDPSGNIFHLVEDRQEFTDGRIRRRDFKVSLSEKLKSSENPDASVIRGIQEELGIEGKIETSKTGEEKENKESQSYPDLATQYHFHNYRADLTPEQHDPEGYVEKQSDKSTFFVWEKV
jgi:hypothetical protein